MLQPARFISSFDVSRHGILSAVSHMVCPEAGMLTAGEQGVRTLWVLVHRTAKQLWD